MTVTVDLDPRGLTRSEITAMLHRWQDGDEDSFNRLILLVYQDLRKMARGCMARASRDRTMEPTALVHEVYQHFNVGKRLEFESRFHFFRTVSLMMRQILGHYARSRNAQKRGGGQEEAFFDEMEGENMFPENGGPLAADTIFALERALEKLQKLDPFKERVVTLRFIVGLSLEEVARVLDSSPRTVKRSWQFSKHWLARELRQG